MKNISICVFFPGDVIFLSTFFPPGFDFSCAGDALDFYFCSFACNNIHCQSAWGDRVRFTATRFQSLNLTCDAPCSCSYSSSCPYLCSCSSSSRPGLLSPSSSPPRPSSRCSSPRWTPTSYSHVWQAWGFKGVNSMFFCLFRTTAKLRLRNFITFGHPWCLEAQPTSPWWKANHSELKTEVRGVRLQSLRFRLNLDTSYYRPYVA